MAAGNLTGISPDTLYSWRVQAKAKQFKQLSVVGTKSLTVTDTDAVIESDISNPLKSVTVTDTTPKGFLIEGLPPNLAVEFLLKIGVR